MNFLSINWWIRSLVKYYHPTSPLNYNYLITAQFITSVYHLLTRILQILYLLCIQKSLQTLQFRFLRKKELDRKIHTLFIEQMNSRPRDFELYVKDLD